tara:strand:- start:224 stop:835 length:612 start_codon:yes stop_codon:yes gene_type:complete
VIEIIDNYASEDLYNQLLVENLYYGKVHWVGIRAEPENVLHDLVHEVYCSNVEQEDITGATAWYNIRPKNQKIHNDIDSYSTQKGISYRPEVLPEKTFLYYLKSPDNGGQLAIYTRASFVRAGQDIIWDDSEVDTISAIVNRLISMPANVTHRVLPYAGNRVSIGIIFWVDLPKIYPEADPNVNDVYDRIWEVEDSEQIALYV